MSEILFIRHAETYMAGTFCGHSDPTLSTRGRTQLHALLETLHMEDIHVVYTSDLLRAQETAEAIATSHAVERHPRHGLREIHFGQWEGLTWKEIEHRDSSYAQRWVTEYPDLPAPDGERFHDFERRVLDEVNFLTTKAEERSIAVVTHAGVLRTVLHRLCGYTEEKAWERAQSYCSIIRYKNSTPTPMQTVEVAS